MRTLALFFLILLLPNMSHAQNGWWNADRSSVNIAPLPAKEKRAIVQIYAARAYSWRGNFAVHSWVATKDKDADHYMVYQVMGFGGGKVVHAKPGIPDGKWYGNMPELLYELKGSAAEKMIPQIQQASKDYPYQEFYRLYPGPNSNTYVSYLIRHTPGLYMELPPHALGKDWIDDGKLFGRSESGTGFQVSILGMLGFTIGLAEGIEINLAGMTFGVDILRPALKLPFIGRIGLKDRPIFGSKALPETEKSPTEPDPMVTPGAV